MLLLVSGWKKQRRSLKSMYNGVGSMYIHSKGPLISYSVHDQDIEVKSILKNKIGKENYRSEQGRVYIHSSKRTINIVCCF